ncbi:hypothetical protein EON80_07285 [bacterium]|nr:MAG: hypothetical protein EON80_07285 [bacterium]
MKRFDSSSRRLLAFSTACSLSLLAIPTLRTRVSPSSWFQNPVIWSVSAAKNDRTAIFVDPQSDTVSTYDGSGYVERRFSDGKKIGVWSPPIFSSPHPAASLDGRKLVGLGYTATAINRLSMRLSPIGNQLQVWDTKLHRVTAKLPAANNFKGNTFRIYNASDSEVAVVEDCRSADCKPSVYVADVLWNLNDGKKKLFLKSAWHPELASVVAPSGTILWGRMGDRDSNDSSQEFFLDDNFGHSHRLELDPKDRPTSASDNWTCPTLLFNKSQSRLWGSVQFADSLRVGRTGSFVCWDWKTGKPLWRWQETDVQPVKVDLSADEKYLAVGCTVVLPSTYARAVRLVIIDAQTGALVRDLVRPRGGKMQRAFNFVTRAADQVQPSGYNVPAVLGVRWAPDGKSLLAAYADGELIRWRT